MNGLVFYARRISTNFQTIGTPFFPISWWKLDFGLASKPLEAFTHREAVFDRHLYLTRVPGGAPTMSSSFYRESLYTGSHIFQFVMNRRYRGDTHASSIARTSLLRKAPKRVVLQWEGQGLFPWYRDYARLVNSARDKSPQRCSYQNARDNGACIKAFAA